MAEDAQVAQELWRSAKSLRNNLSKEFEQATDPSTDERALLDRFKKVGDLLAQYRQYCVTTVWADWRFASEEKVEDLLWQTHVRAIRAYRTVKERLSGPQQAVTRNKVTRHYQSFLKVSQEFYRGYLQRNSARYNTLPELQRALKGAALEEIDVPENEHVDAAAAKIDKLVVESAYRILVCLGDLARYRALLKPEKERNFDTALAYYNLATDVDHTLGMAHHQMAMILREEHRHMDLVYCLYRAMVAKQPHQLASKNLELAFKSVLRDPPPRTGRDQAHEALQSWFPRLHAHFYSGREFTQHNELEKEVLGRFDKAVKAHDFADGLLKMILTNICAYEVASNKVKAEWTEEASLTCQFIMRLHIQMIQLISAHVETELSDLIDTMRTAPGQANGTNTKGKTADTFSPVIKAALPLLRVCMTWICMYRTQIVDFEPHLVPYLPSMYKTLSRALTRFIELMELLQTQQNDQFKPVNFLFAEDTMTLGLQFLHGPELPKNCQLSVDCMNGQLKPRFEQNSNVVYKPDDVTYTRAVDITYRAFTLTNDAKFPFALSQDRSSVLYLEDGKPAHKAGTSNSQVTRQMPMANTQPVIHSKAVVADKPAIHHQRQDSDRAAALRATLGLTRSPDGSHLVQKQASPEQAPTQQPTPKMAPGRPTPKQTPRAEERGELFASTPAGQSGKFVRQSVNLGSGPIKPTRQPNNPPSGQLETNFKRHPKHPSNVQATATVPSVAPVVSFNLVDESRVFDMVKDFLEPRETQQPQQARGESSYGMHTNTALDLFGTDLASSPARTPITALGPSSRIPAQRDVQPTPPADNGWGSPGSWHNGPQNSGVSLNGPQSGWPTTSGFTDRGMNSGVPVDGQFGHAPNNSGGFPSSGNLAPGTHWSQDSRGLGPPAQPDPWRQAPVQQPRQPAPRFNASNTGPIRSLDDALAAQLQALIQDRSSFSPAVQASTPHHANNYNQLPVPGSFGSSQFAFSQDSSRPQVNNSPWGMGNNSPTGGFPYQAGAPSGNVTRPPPGFGAPGGPGSSQQPVGSSNGMGHTQHSQQNSQNGYSNDQPYYTHF